MADQPIIYGVWITGQGWLKLAGDRERTFVSTQKEVAESAAALWGKGAAVMPWDKSMLDFELMFISRQKALQWWVWKPRSSTR